MKKIFEDLYFFKINIKNDKIIIKNDKHFLKYFYLSSFVYQLILNSLLFFYNKNNFYDEAIFIEFRVEPIQRITCLYFATGYLIFLFIQNSKQNLVICPIKSQFYNFLFLTNIQIIKQKLKLNQKFSRMLVNFNFTGEILLKKIFIFNDFFFSFYSVFIAYLKLKNSEINFIFFIKIILSIHLYFILCFGYKLFFFEIVKQNFILNYMNLKLQNENHKLNLIKQKLVIVKNYSKFFKNTMISKKNLQVEKKLKNFFKNYNKILVEQELLKKDFGFACCLLICVLFIWLFLTLIVFYRHYNIAANFIASIFYPSLLIGCILPVVITNVKQSGQVIKNIVYFKLILI